MKATETALLPFLNGLKQFAIPVYQRPYSWQRDQCKQLWDDIVNVAEAAEGQTHFIGAVVYIQDGTPQAANVQQWLVIDGQQRLTTLSLLLAALVKTHKATLDEDKIATGKQIENDFLFNNRKGNLRYKLVLGADDNDTYQRLIDDRDMGDKSAQRLLDNYHFFADQIQTRQIDPERIIEGISRLTLIDVSLNRLHGDNPQLIFESLNSTGLALSQADLIRNFLLMGLSPDEQTRLYIDYWQWMERRFDQDETSPKFDHFMRDYLTVQNKGTIPNLGNVYADFKRFISRVRLTQTTEAVLWDIHRCARHYSAIWFADSQYEPDSAIRDVLVDLKELKVEVANPFLLTVYDDYQHHLLTRDDFVKILRLVESYVFRRSVVGIPTNALNKIFANLSNEIDKTNYVLSLQRAFLKRKGKTYFPPDNDFSQKFTLWDVYTNAARRVYVLRKLENFERKEPVSVGNYTIEHVMPQSLTLHWEKTLGPDWQRIRDQYLHTIGNLTLTGYNSEYSNHPFEKKRDMQGGFRDSPLYLNKSLANAQTWNEEQIIVRGKALAERALHIWADVPRQLAFDDQLLQSNPSWTLATMRGGHFFELRQVAALYDELRAQILKLSPTIRDEIKGQYIAFKLTTNFADVRPTASGLKLMLNMPYSKIDDPRGRCRDMTGKGKWGNGDVEIALTTPGELNYAMQLVRQAFEHQTGEEG